MIDDLGLIFAGAFRKPLRAILLIITAMIAFLLFGMLGAFLSTLNAGINLTAANRLVVANKINFTSDLPYSYIERVRRVSGVTAVTWANWFGAYFQEPRNQIVTFAVDPESYLEVFSELQIPADQRAAFVGDRTGLLVGEATATRLGWKIGDTVPLQSNFLQRSDGEKIWPLTVRAIYTLADPKADTSALYLHYDYLNEANSFGKDKIGLMYLLTADPAQNEQIVRAIDDGFSTDRDQTATTTERAFAQGFLAQLGNLTQLLTSVMAAAFVSLALIVGNTMVMALRERTKEIGVMKTLGFGAGRVMRLVIGEAVLLVGLGGALGLALASVALVGLASQAAAFFPGLGMSNDVLLIGAGLVLGLGALTGAIPGVNAYRMRIVEAMGKGN